MQKLYQSNFQDVEFKLDDGRVFGAHKVVLLNSKVEWFKTMLTSKFKDSEQKTLEIHDIESDVFEIALKYAYDMLPSTGKFEFEIIYPIFKAANYFTCFDLSNQLIKRATYQQEKLCCLDCALQFGGKILEPCHGLKLSIEEVRLYFLDKYVNNNDGEDNEEDKEEDKEENEKIALNLINETLEISSLDQANIWTFLYESLETCDEECIIILLKKIDYITMSISNKLGINVLTRLAKRGLVPYLEIIHLLTYGMESFIIDTFPLKVGYLSAHGEIGTFMFGWDPKRRQRINMEYGHVVAQHVQYVYYDNGDLVPNKPDVQQNNDTISDVISVVPFEDEPGFFLDINNNFILRQNEDGTVTALYADENGVRRDLTENEKRRVRSMGLYVDVVVAVLPELPPLQKQCKFVYQRGEKRGEQCENYADEHFEYCRSCRKKGTVIRMMNGKK